MSLAHYLFGFSGRINRAKQWAVLLVSLVHTILLGLVFAYTIGFAAIGEMFEEKMTLAALIATPGARTFGIVFGVLYVIGVYFGCAVATKRLHDRGKSAWWLLVFYALPLLLNVPVLMHMQAIFANLGATMHALQVHLPPPRPPVETPLEILSRGAATIIGLWAFVELFILRGTVGDNRYGPDPLAGRG